MARLPRVTQNIFGSSAGFQQLAQIGSLNAAAPVYTTNLATIQALSNYAAGLYNVVIGGNSPAIQDINALFFLITSQLAYLLTTGVSEYDAGTTYSTGDIVAQPVVVFLVSSANATAGATYTNNTQTFTVQSTISANNKLVCTYTGLPTSSGALTKASGAGDATITFTSEAVSSGQWVSIADTNLGNAVTDTAHWMPYIPSLGKPFQRLSTDSTSSFTEYTYHTINDSTPLASYTVPSGYNLMAGFISIATGLTWNIAGTFTNTGPLKVTGTLIVSGTLRVI